MGYTNRNSTIKRVEQFLKQMVDAKDSLTWVTDGSEQTRKLAYYLREAISYARRNGETYPEYAELRDKFILRERDKKLIAEIREYTPVLMMAQALSKMQVNGVGDVMGIVGACVQHGAAKEIYFPDASLTDADCDILYKWGLVSGYHLIVGEGVTVTKEDPGEIKWTPTP
jgi:hypothetical protein